MHVCLIHVCFSVVYLTYQRRRESPQTLVSVGCYCCYISKYMLRVPFIYDVATSKI